MKLLIASTNLHKIREFKQLLKKQSSLDIYSLLDFPTYKSPEETGSTFEENALIKAEHAATHLKMFTLADDSGLVVPALNNAPGVYSARYAGDHKSDLDNRCKLLQEMSHLKGLQRAAFFECCIAIVSPDGFKKTARGVCEGMILEKERGKKGFGFDPLFLKYGYSLTFAEVDESVKNQISHRFKALQKVLTFLES